jgi:hypothetical protein
MNTSTWNLYEKVYCYHFWKWCCDKNESSHRQTQRYIIL